MELLAIILEVRFSQKTSLIEVKDNRKFFVETISNEKIAPPPEVAQGLQHRDDKTKTLVVLEENRFAISTELSNLKNAQDRVLEILKEVYAKFKYKDNSIVRIGVKTQWAGNWSSSFTALIKSYKDVFYNQNSLLNEATDVAINFTLDDKPFKVNYISGPMKPEQGKNILLFKDRNLPHDFIFTDIDRFDMNNKVSNNYTSIKEFVDSSINYGKDKTTQTIELLGGHS